MRALLGWSILTTLSFTFFFQIYPGFLSPNESSRLLLVSALVDDHTLSIDRAMARYGDTEDKALYQGRHYSNKAIGYSLLALPFYLPLSLWAGALTADVAQWPLKLLVNLIPLGFFTVWFFRHLRDRVGAGARAYVLLAAFLFASLIHAYAQMFVSHVLTGLCTYLAFAWVTEHDERIWSFAAGCALGFSFLLEIPSLVMVAVFGIWLLAYRPRALIPLLAGVALFSWPAFLYNHLAFAGPLDWPYRHAVAAAHQRAHGVGYTGIGVPSPTVLWELTFGGARGLFYFMPHLLFGVVGLAGERTRAADARLAGGIVVVQLLFYSGYSYWDGGWSYGPRFLIPLIPFLVYGTALWLARVPRSGAFCCYLALVGFSLIALLPATVTFPYPPGPAHALFAEYPILFWRGSFGFHLGQVVGLPAAGVQGVALLIGVLPALLLMRAAGLSRAELLAFLAPIVVMVALAAGLHHALAERIGAPHCLAIGRMAYMQGNLTLADEFLDKALERNPEPDIRRGAEHWRARVRAAQVK